MKRIDIFPWNDNFDTGIAEIDGQHRQLVILLNQLASHVAYSSDPAELNDILDELVRYTIYHFETEEAIWHSHLASAPGVLRHLRLHGDFAATIRQLKDSQGAKAHRKIAEEMLAFLTRWLVSHILESDRYLAYVVLGMRAGLTQEAATKAAGERMSGATRVLTDIILNIYETLSINALNLMEELSAHKSAEERYRQIFDTSLDAISITRLDDGSYVEVNPAFEKITGFRRDEVIGRSGRELGLWADYAQRTRLLDGLRRDGHVRDQEVQLRKRDGGPLWGLISSIPIVANGESQLLSVTRDITDRRKVEQELAVRRAQLDTLIESVPDSIQFKDGDGRWLIANRMCLRLFGLVGKEWENLTDHEIGLRNPALAKTMAACRAGDEKAWASGQAFHDEEVVTDGGGRTIHFDVVKVPLFDERQQRKALIIVARDITEHKQIERRILEREQELRTILDSVDGYIYLKDPEGRYLFANKKVRELWGREMDGIVGFGDDHFFDAQTAGRIRMNDRAVLAEGRTIKAEETNTVSASGKSATFLSTKLPLRDENGGIYALCGISTDISELKKTEQELRIAATAFESQEGMFITDAAANILRVNRAFSEITGYAAAEAVGRNPRLLSSGRHPGHFYAAMWRAIQRSGAWEGEIWNRRKNGDIYPQYLAITAVRDAGGAVVNYVASMADITQRKNSEEEIQRLAFYDQLTNLPNRRLLMDRLKQALAVSSRTRRHGALFFIDLDNFKTLNDTLGHLLGDLLLQQVAGRLDACVREGDTVSRLGGDEFVVMLEDLDDDVFAALKHAEAVGEKIVACLRQPYRLLEHDYSCTPSIGISIFHGRDQNTEDVLKQADIAMYQAKRDGRDTIRFFDSQMQQTINQRAALEAELRRALEGGQLALHYQAQVDSAGRVFGAEALIRWQHPERGLISPADFIPLAEESGLILPLGQWVIDTACVQLARWAAGAPTRGLELAINVSARQFRQGDFVARLRDTLRRRAADPRRLKLELTESLLLENVDETIRTMEELHALGVQISLDDFGTGYSSLQYLKRLPLNQLKIDRSFIADITGKRSDLAIVHTIIAMAQTLGLEVIAEGVENEEQRRLLLASGCRHYQGFFFGRPLPVAQFEAALAG